MASLGEPPFMFHAAQRARVRLALSALIPRFWFRRTDTADNNPYSDNNSSPRNLGGLH